MSYASARDLPSFLDMEQQLAVLRALPGAAGAEAEAVERGMRELAETVDAFYELLNTKHWIFHEHLSLTAVRTILTDAGDDADRAEHMLIDHYHDRDQLFFLILPLKKLPAMRRRLPLVERAREDYFAGRYYSCIHVLLSVMDGFVNEFETVRRGLHAREVEELDAWDSVVGHHYGLTHAHKTFRKGRTKTSEDSVFELHRNGIVHGSLLNYDNIVVATKAWNRLFAVADWAHARTKEQQQETAAPATWPAVRRQLKDLLARAADQAAIRRANQQWTPREYLADTEGFIGHPARERTEQLLTWWTRRNYGSMGDFITQQAHARHGNAIRSEVRRTYEKVPLESFTVLCVSHDMAAACTVTVRLGHVGREPVTVGLRWIREGGDAYPRPEPWPGEWRLSTWQPFEFLTQPVT